MAKDVKSKSCFVVGPIGGDESDDRIHADWLLEEIIEPVFKDNFTDFSVTRADKISNPGQITSQVITTLLDADLVIADLTTLNPNAFYEIGIRHTIQKPIIHMHLEGQSIPFDIAPFRSIKFSRRKPADIRAARALLLEFVREATDPDHQIDNPVTFSRGKLQFSEKATPTERLLQEEISGIADRLKSVEAITQKHADIGFASFGRTTIKSNSRSIMMNVSAPTPEILVDFLRHRLDIGFSGITLVEDNDTGQIIRVPDTPGNRRALENLADEARVYEYPVSINLTHS